MDKNINMLESASMNTPMFSLKDNIFTAKVVKIIDGDSIHAVFIPFTEPSRFIIRLNGIDTCEVHSKNEEEKKYGLLAKNKLSELIMDKYITIHCHEFDKYGRLLADLFIDDINVCEYMENIPYTIKYNGKTKPSFEDRKKQYDSNLK